MSSRNRKMMEVGYWGAYVSTVSMTVAVAILLGWPLARWLGAAMVDRVLLVATIALLLGASFFLGAWWEARATRLRLERDISELGEHKAALKRLNRE